MALATYTDLLTQLATSAIRTDQTSNWPNFIALCEAEMARVLVSGKLPTPGGLMDLGGRTPPQMETMTAAFSIDAEYEDKPADLLAVKGFQITSTDPAVRLERLDAANIERLTQDEEYYQALLGDLFDTDTPGPKWYAEVGTQFRFFPVPETTYTAELIYDRTIPGLQANSTNWLMTTAPDAYLYGALVQFGVTVQDERLPVWRELYLGALQGLRHAYPRETERSKLRTEFPQLSPSGWAAV
jgi:hypothetical protein